MKNIIRLLLLIIILAYSTVACPQQQTLINWVSMSEAEVRVAALPKPLMIYFYTDWCKFCKEMERNTFSNEQIAAYINQNFYCVRVNGEGYDTITFKDTTYYNTGEGKRSTHDFPKAILGERLTYPTTMFFNNQHQFRFVVPGMVDIVKFEPMLVYVLENVFLTETYEPFEAAFLRTFRPDSPELTRSRVEHTDITQMNQGRKSIVSFNAEWCNSCRVMNHSTFLNPAIRAIVNEYFEVASMHVASSDTIYWYGKEYLPNPQGGVHSFISTFAGSQMLLPLMFVFDEAGNLLTPLPRYQPATSLVQVLIYFGEDHYKEMTWEEFKELH